MARWNGSRQLVTSKRVNFCCTVAIGKSMVTELSVKSLADDWGNAWRLQNKLIMREKRCHNELNKDRYSLPGCELSNKTFRDTKGTFHSSRYTETMTYCIASGTTCTIPNRSGKITDRTYSRNSKGDWKTDLDGRRNGTRLTEGCMKCCAIWNLALSKMLPYSTRSLNDQHSQIFSINAWLRRLAIICLYLSPCIKKTSAQSGTLVSHNVLTSVEAGWPVGGSGGSV